MIRSCYLYKSLDIYEIQEFLSKFDPEVSPLINEFLLEYGASEPQPNVAYGTFVGGELVQILLTCESQVLPLWYLVGVYRLKNQPANLLTAAWAEVALDYTNLGFHAFATAYPTKHARAIQRLWKSEEWFGWSVATLMEIPALTRPPFTEVFNVLMNRELNKEDLTVRLFSHYGYH